MKKFILIIFMAMISTFSYYGTVNEKGEKVVNFETTPQKENIITNEIAEETQENVTNEIENTIAQVEEIQQEETKQQNTTKENQTTPVAESNNNTKKNKTQPTQTKQDTQVNEQQETKANNSNAIEKNEETNTNTNTNQNTNITNNAPKCTHSSNGWYNSKAEAEAIYNAEIKKWGDKWTNYEIDNDTYYKNCPSGYEVFSCPYCNKWTINLF